NSIEFDPETKYPMIYLIDNFINQSGEQELRTHKSPMGGTLRLGEYPCDTKEGSLLRLAYKGETTIYERHRHRYEANPTYREALENAGMIVTGESHGLIEAVEIVDHPWFLGVQFHPEFTSHLQTPNPSVFAFVEATLNHVENA
ncbi:MAG: gamma-glutamyl-gamma-aminobutyrate hydrolase family protein, partial [Sulfurimonadaceae bacterium]|nr:gamma-glutamyl-gamma-aminobutyrate hydrolase family protein [Sulfurimonadaceae bacterium]